jgi:fucose 4-O-acetylase-like acetyltransferase
VVVATRLRKAAADISARTPDHRERSVDLVRAASILVVVIGHWLAVAVFVDDGSLDGLNVLAVLAWTHPFTWLFQVMPLFFLVGGFANAASWTSHRRERGRGWVAWVLHRLGRLLRPTTWYLAIGVASVVAARAAGAASDLVEDAAWLVNIALWFLAVYVAVTAAAPVMLAAHERWGAAVVVALVIGVAVVDGVALGWGVEQIRLLNFALGWLALQQLGFLWRSGGLTAHRAIPVIMAALGLVIAAALTVAGPYPVSMVGVPGQAIDNTAPPTVALLALGIAQAGAILMLRPVLERIGQRPLVWLAVVAVNARILTIYLWHLVPVVVAAPLLVLIPTLGEMPIGSTGWLWLRPVWVLCLAGALVAIVAATGRWEASPREHAVPPRDGLAPITVAVAGVVCVSAGLVLFTLQGLHGAGPLGLPTRAVGVYALGLGLSWAANRLGMRRAGSG